MFVCVKHLHYAIFRIISGSSILAVLRGRLIPRDAKIVHGIANFLIDKISSLCNKFLE